MELGLTEHITIVPPSGPLSIDSRPPIAAAGLRRRS
jgi:hypothetical protein